MTVSFGEWERATDVPPVLYRDRLGFWRLKHARRRRRYEKWRDADGQQRGRWEWEYEA